MRCALLLVFVLALSGCTSSPSPGDAPSSSTSGPTTSHPANHTAPAPPQRLTWNLDKDFGLHAENVTAGQIALTGATDPSHGRDLLRFVGPPATSATWLSNFTVHLIFEAATPWTGGVGGVEVWFGYEIPSDPNAAPSFPVNGGADLGLQQGGTRFDVRLNETNFTPGGVGIPAGAQPVFLVAVTGTQSAAAPLMLDVGGDKNSHVHPVVAPWNRTARAIVPGPHEAGTFTAGSVPGVMGSRTIPLAVTLPDAADGWIVVVQANNTNSLPTDLDVQVLDGAGAVLAESNSPYAHEALRLYGPNVNATGRALFVRVEDASTTPTAYWLQVFFLEPNPVPRA